MVGSKNYMGSFEFEVGSRIQDAVEGPVSKAFIQHWFQEQFLKLFYEDADFRDQVLRCLLAGDTDEGTVQVRKPRRTWLKRFDGEGIQNVALPFAEDQCLYGGNECLTIGLCTLADRTSQWDNEETRINFSKLDSPKFLYGNHDNFSETFMNFSKGVKKDSYPSEINMGREDFVIDDSVFPPHGEPEGRYWSLGLHPLCMPNNPGVAQSSDSEAAFPAAACLHRSRSWSWKANPLYTHNNFDVDSTDSWQQEHVTVAWLDDLENRKMLEEVKMRKMRTSENSCASPGVMGCNGRSESPESDSDVEIKFGHAHRAPAPVALNADQEAQSSSASVSKQATVRSDDEMKPVITSISRDLPPSEQEDHEEARTSAAAANDSRTISRLEFSDERIKPPITRISGETQCVSIVEDEEAAKGSLGSVSRVKMRLNEELKPQIALISQVSPFVVACDVNDEVINGPGNIPQGIMTGTMRLDVEFKMPTISLQNHEPTSLLPNMSAQTSNEITSQEFKSPTISRAAQTVANIHEDKEFETTAGPTGKTNSILDEDLNSCPIISTSENLEEEDINSPSMITGSSPCEGIASAELMDEELKPGKKNGEKNSLEQQSLEPSLGGISHAATPCRPACGRIDDMEKEILDSSGNICTNKETLDPVVTNNSEGGTLCVSINESNEQPDSATVATKTLSSSRGTPGVSRAKFRPSKDIQWLPPQRKIRFVGLDHARQHGVRSRSKQQSEDTISDRNVISRNVTWDRSLKIEGNASAEGGRMVQASRSHRGNRGELWGSIVRSLFKRTRTIPSELHPKKSDFLSPREVASRTNGLHRWNGGEDLGLSRSSSSNNTQNALRQI